MASQIIFYLLTVKIFNNIDYKLTATCDPAVVEFYNKSLSLTYNFKRNETWYLRLETNGNATINIQFNATQFNATHIFVLNDLDSSNTSEITVDTSFNTSWLILKMNHTNEDKELDMQIIFPASRKNKVAWSCDASDVGSHPPNTEGKASYNILVIGASLILISILLVLIVIISVCCTVKKHKKIEQKEVSQFLKSSMGDTYEVIKDYGKFEPQESGKATTEIRLNSFTQSSAGRESGHRASRATNQADMLYSLADGKVEQPQKEDYDVISESPKKSYSLARVATPFLLATQSGLVHLPKLRTLPRKSADCSLPSPIASPEPDLKVKESTYHILDRSGRSQSFEKLVSNSYYDVDIRQIKTQRHQCQTADVVTNKSAVFDFSPKFYSENMYCLQRSVSIRTENSSSGDEGHIYEAYERSGESNGSEVPADLRDTEVSDMRRKSDNYDENLLNERKANEEIIPNGTNGTQKAKHNESNGNSKTTQMSCNEVLRAKVNGSNATEETTFDGSNITEVAFHNEVETVSLSGPTKTKQTQDIVPLIMEPSTTLVHEMEKGVKKTMTSKHDDDCIPSLRVSESLSNCVPDNKDNAKITQDQRRPFSM